MNNYNYRSEFFYKIEKNLGETETYYSWYLVHKEKHQGVHFHGRKSNVSKDRGVCLYNSYNFTAYEIEMHSPVPKYEGDRAHGAYCWVTNGDCYHDGSSLMAQERLGHINPEDESDQMCIWNVLHNFYESQFNSLKD